MDVQELRFEVVVDPTLPAIVDGAVTFDTGAKDEDRLAWAYAALSSFYEDLILGAPWPFRMAIHTVRGVDTVVAVALFSGRDLALQPGTAAFVSAVSLYRRHGLAGLAHIPADVGKFLVLLNGYFPRGLSKEQTGERLTHAVFWVREYLLEDRLPHLGASPAPFRVVDVGSNGFAIVECDRPSLIVWPEVYRQGFLRGVLIGPDRDARRMIVASRKSRFIDFDLMKASRMLNELEVAAGGVPNWAATELSLESPADGTLVLPSTLLEVLLRC